MTNNIAEQFKSGVELIIEHKRSLLAFCEERDDYEMDAALTHVQELGGAVAALEFNVPQDVFYAMHAEACERLQKAV
jgi:hypothetical protein